MENGEIETVDEEMSSQNGRQYRPVVCNDQAVIQMSSIGSSSHTDIPVK